MHFQTNDISLAAYLTLNGYSVVDTSQSGRMMTFIFPKEAEELGRQWQLSPTDEMRTIQQYTNEKERLFKVIKESRENYGWS